jgi:hypothetical protein
MKKIKSIVSLALVLAILFSFAPPVSLAFDPSGDSVVESTASYDIYINTDQNFPVSADDFTDMLKAKMVSMGGNPDGNGGVLNIVTEDEIKTTTSVTNIDTTDLSGWYVYDHYNTEYWNNSANWAGASNREDAWMAKYSKSTTTDYSRPAFWVTDSNATGSAYTSIENLLTSGSPNAATVKSRVGISHRMQEHIYSYMDEHNKPGMWFLGYGSYSIMDFLFYPTTTTLEKNVKFTVDSDYVNNHAFTGAGFLANAGIDNSTGNISGYVVLYSFSGTNANKITLYKINNNISASAFHDGTTWGSTSVVNTSNPTAINAATRINSLATQVASAEIPTWSPQTDIEAIITENKISVYQAAADGVSGVAGAGSGAAAIIDYTISTPTGYQGFGPLAHYNGSGHTCSQASSFKFSNLEMSFATESSSVLDSLTSSDYLRNAEKYFVNLLSNDAGGTVNSDDWANVARVKESEIYFVSNVRNPFLNDGGVVSSGAPLGDNGATFAGLDPSDADDLDELIENIARYILTGKTWQDSGSAPIIPPDPVGIFYMMVQNPSNGREVQLTDIVRDFISDPSGIPVYADNFSLPGAASGGGESTITERKYTILKPASDGAMPSVQEVVTFTSAADLNADRNTIFNVLRTSFSGTYTVTLEVTTADGKTSAPVSSSFTVGADPSPPQGTWNTPSSNASTFEDVDTPLDITLTDVGYGVAAYRIGLQYKESDGSYSAAQSAKGYPDEETLVPGGFQASYNMTIDIPLGVFRVNLEIWDGAGRMTEAYLEVDNRYDLANTTDTIITITETEIVIPGAPANAYSYSTSVTYKGRTLVQDVDYTLQYVRGTITGPLPSPVDYDAVITGLGDYKNSQSKVFTNPSGLGLFDFKVTAIDGSIASASGTCMADAIPDADLDRLIDGEDLTIEIEMERVDNIKDVDMVAYITGWRVIGKDEYMRAWFDVNAYITVGTDPRRPIDEFDDYVRVTLELPRNTLPPNFTVYSPIFVATHPPTINASRTLYSVYKSYDLDNVDATGTFDIKYFSLYSLMYWADPASAKNKPLPNTADNAPTELLAITGTVSVLMVATAVIIEVRRRKKRGTVQVETESEQ